MLAIARGEQISAIWFVVVVALSSYAIAYRFYAYYIQIKIMRTDDANATAAERVQDGANFERADRRVLFGQHFAAISGAGPLVGPILAAQMGYLPSVLWIILGVIFAGAVQDMLMLWISAKRRGRSFGQMATDEMGKVGVLIISVFLVVVAAIAMAFLALVAIKAMASSPWAVFSLGMTIPIALIMGCYERFLRPGRVIETTILGFVLLVLAIVGGGMIAANPVLAPIFTLNAKQLVVALVLYSFAAADDREHEQHEAENRRFDHTARAQEPLIAPHDQGDWDRHAEREHRPRRRRHRLDRDEREERHRDGGDDDKEHGDDEAADLAHLVGGHLTE